MGNIAPNVMVYAVVNCMNNNRKRLLFKVIYVSNGKKIIGRRKQRVISLEYEETIREKLEKKEHEYLSPYASCSDESKGRMHEEEKCDVRTDYQRDRDRILHSKAFRRMKHKTQVFLAPEGDHYRTRLTHTLEVSQIARTIAKSLFLNEDLTEAIALGHDLGHTPFGHSGEKALQEICPRGFAHHEQSLRVVERLENHGHGLNLTWEVRDGILHHQTSGKPGTMEGQIVRLADKIAYINHDIEDAVRAGIMIEQDIPREYGDVLGVSKGERLDTLIHDVISNSQNSSEIRMSKTVQDAMYGLRGYLFRLVYTNPAAKCQEKKAMEMVKRLYQYCLEHQEVLSEEYGRMIEEGKEPIEQVVCDYVAGMTDNYAINKYTEWFIPMVWK